MIQLLHNGISVLQVCLIYDAEANCLSVEDSHVRELRVHRDFSTLARSSKMPRWHSFAQLPFSEARLSEIRALNQRNTGTINKKLLAVSNTVERGKGKGTSNLSDCYFLSTYDQHTRVTDIDAAPMQGAGVGGWKDGVRFDSS